MHKASERIWRIYISYDSTNKNCQAGEIEVVEFGHAKDNRDKPVFDRSYFSKKNIGFLNRSGFAYVIMARGGALRLCGYIALVTSEVMTAAEALRIYRGRGASEKRFHGDRIETEYKNLLVRRNESRRKMLMDAIAKSRCTFDEEINFTKG